MRMRRYRRRRRRPAMTSRLKRSITRRLTRRLKPYKNPRKQEVKLHTTYLNGFAVGAMYSSTPTTDLFDRSIVCNSSRTDGLLGHIGQGITKSTRIGNQIFVKKMVFKMFLWTCPTSSQTTYQDGVTVRALITNTRAKYSGIGLYNAPNYFRTPESHQMVQAPDRSTYNVYHDRLYYWRPQIGVRGANAGDNMGYGREVRITLPINRTVTYNDNGIVKEDRDVINLYLWGHIPMNTTDNKQLLCGNMTVTTYYTDS